MRSALGLVPTEPGYALLARGIDDGSASPSGDPQAIHKRSWADLGLSKNQQHPSHPHADLASGFCSNRAPSDPSRFLPRSRVYWGLTSRIFAGTHRLLDRGTTHFPIISPSQPQRRPTPPARRSSHMCGVHDVFSESHGACMRTSPDSGQN